MKKILSVFTIAAFAMAILVSCGKQGNAEKPKLRFVTGGESGTYYAFGSVIAQHATNNTGVTVVGLAGNGSQVNIMALEERLAELAFCQSDVMAYAYNGTSTFANTGKIDCFSTLGALYVE